MESKANKKFQELKARIDWAIEQVGGEYGAVASVALSESGNDTVVSAGSAHNQTPQNNEECCHALEYCALHAVANIALSCLNQSQDTKTALNDFYEMMASINRRAVEVATSNFNKNLD